MRLFIDTSRLTKVEVVKPFEARLDNDGNHRKDNKRGGTGLPLYACKLAVWSEGDMETVLVTVATENPPKLAAEQLVTLHDLEAMPWSTNKGEPRVAYRASSVAAVSANKSVPPVKAAS